MSVFVPIALAAWPLVTVALFAFLRPSRALVAAYAGAWLFLPMASIPLPMIPDLSKVTAASYGVLAGALLFRNSALFAWRPKLVDVPMLCWCICELFSSVSNGLGVWDGVSAVFKRTMLWGVPYFMGRVFLSDRKALRDCAVGIFVGGLVYAPLCLYEIRMWQPLHQLVYGSLQDSWLHLVRFGGFRPIVFMQSGLMVGLWMSSAGLIGIWLWRNSALKRLWIIPAGLLAVFQASVGVMCRSAGATALMLMGLGASFLGKWFRTRLPVIVLIVVPVIYIPARAMKLFSIDPILDVGVEGAAALVGEERASSLAGRLHKELYYSEHARQQLIFGWGGYGRMRPIPEEAGEPVRGVDSLWIIAFGKNGLVGLISLTLAVLLPVGLLLSRFRPAQLYSAALAPATALALVLGLYMIDSLLNAMVNPTYALAMGGISGFCVAHFKPTYSRLRSG